MRARKPALAARPRDDLDDSPGRTLPAIRGGERCQRLPDAAPLATVTRVQVEGLGPLDSALDDVHCRDVHLASLSAGAAHREGGALQGVRRGWCLILELDRSVTSPRRSLPLQLRPARTAVASPNVGVKPDDSRADATHAEEKAAELLHGETGNRALPEADLSEVLERQVLRQLHADRQLLQALAEVGGGERSARRENVNVLARAALSVGGGAAIGPPDRLRYLDRQVVRGDLDRRHVRTATPALRSRGVAVLPSRLRPDRRRHEDASSSSDLQAGTMLQLDRGRDRHGAAGNDLEAARHAVDLLRIEDEQACA